MEKKHLLALLLFVCGLQTPRVLAQGSLTPPGAPSPTMKTLAQVEPRIPISALPYTISAAGSYYVTTNLVANTGGVGLTISSGNVSVDLNGFAINGAKLGNTGIYVSGSYTNIAIQNGTVTSWTSSGINTYTGGYPRQVRLETLNVFDNGGYGIFAEADTIIRNCRVTLNVGDGIYCFGGEIIDCTARTNFSYGINVSHCTVRNCRVEYNYGGGMAINDSRVLDCAVDSNGGTAISSFSGGQNEIRRCHICANAANGGIVLSGKGPGYVSDCLIGNNEGLGILVTGHGFAITGNDCYSNTTGGIILQGSNNRVDGNHVVTQLSVYGISVQNSSLYTNNVVVRNTVSGGGSNPINYDHPANNDFGPIGTAATATSPWANISH